MSIKGVVTSTNEYLLTFKIDNKTTVHASKLLLETGKFVLPEIGQVVDITSAHHIRGSNLDTLCLCPKSSISAEFGKESFKYEHIVKLIKKYSLGQQDLIAVSDLFTLITKYLNDFGSKEILTLNTLEFILENNNSKPLICENTCLNVNLPKFNIKTVSQSKFVDLQTDKFTDFTYWSFGNHHSKNGHYLFGFLYIHHKFGTLFLIDSLYNILCVIINKRKKRLRPYIDKFVLLEKYVIITEIYSDKKICNMEYILTDLENINVIKSDDCRKTNVLLYENYPGHRKWEYNTSFVILNKSLVMLSQLKSQEFWIEIVIHYSKELSAKRIFLCLDSKYLNIWPYLQKGNSYILYNNNKLSTLNNIEYNRINPKQSQYYLRNTNDAIILEDLGNYEEEYLPQLGQETLDDVLNHEGLVSFRGMLKFRKFNDPVSSRTSRKINLKGFGTPGEKTHVLEFEVGAVKTLTLYLNNWESMLTPVGLIPGVEVAVRNVAVQKKKYCKATALTTLEVIGYHPKVEFQTCNLYSGDGEHWGESYYLGLGDCIPWGVLIWGSITQIFIRSLSIRIACVKCGCISKGQTCPICQLQMELTCTITLFVTDEMGKSQIISKNPEILRLLLGLLPHEWVTWKKCFEEIGVFEFKRYEELNNSSGSEDTDLFLNNLRAYLLVFDQQAMPNLDFKCRKITGDKHYGKNVPLWFALEARKTVLD